jgi:hypothetical protein
MSAPRRRNKQLNLLGRVAVVTGASRGARITPRLYPRRGQPLLSMWAMPHRKHTPGHAVRARAVLVWRSKSCRQLVLLSCQAEGLGGPSKTNSEKHLTLRLRRGYGNSIALLPILGEEAILPVRAGSISLPDCRPIRPGTHIATLKMPSRGCELLVGFPFLLHLLSIVKPK